MKNKLFWMIAVAALLLITVLVALSGSNSSENYKDVKLVNNKIDVKFSVSSSKDGFLGEYFGTENILKLTEGKHTITVDAPGYGLAKKDVSSTDTEVTIDFKKTDAKIDATQVVGSNSNIASARYFAENTWMVVNSRNNPATDDGSVTVAKKVGDSWKIVSQGSAVDTEYLVSIGAPLDLIRYIEGQ